MRRRNLRVVVIALLALAGPASASEPAERVREMLLRGKAVSASEAPREAKLDALRSLARELFDTDAMGRDALGRELALHPEAQQQEFLELFDEFIVRAYLQKLLFFRDPVFEFGRVEIRGDLALVPTTIRTRKDVFSVDYAMRRATGRWAATDIVIEGVSLIRNYGDQFQSLLRTVPFEEILDRLRRKVHRLRDVGEG